MSGDPKTRRLFPCFVAVDGVPPLVIGNAAMLEAKIRLLCKFAPLVEVVTDLRPAERLGRHVGARYLPDMTCREAHRLIAGRPLVILDTLDPGLNAALSATATAAGVPVNVPDNTALCSAYLGAIVDRAPVLVAISTTGAAPVLGQRVRARIETMLPDGFGKLATYLQERRQWLRTFTPARRRSIQHQLVDGPAADHVLADDMAGADRHLHAIMAGTGREDAGRLRLVDIGTGDPGLLSLRGVEAIRNADLLVREVGTPAAIVDLARREAESLSLPLRVSDAGAEASVDQVVRAMEKSRLVVLLLCRSSPVMALLADRLKARGLGGAVIPAATDAASKWPHRPVAETPTRFGMSRQLGRRGIERHAGDPS